MKLDLLRDTFTDDATLGTLAVNGAIMGQTCEDKDRHLEDGGEKVYGQTAIPRGKYKVSLTFSPHFGKFLPEILDVPDYTGVRIHGGNGPSDTLGCILLGAVRIHDGIAQCAATVAKLCQTISFALARGEVVTIEVK